MEMAVARPVIVILAATLPFYGCATPSKDVASDPSNHPAVLAAKNADLEVKILGVVKVGEGWLEYQLSVANLGRQPLSQLRGVLVEGKGTEYEAASDATMLEKPFSGTQMIAQDTAVMGAATAASAVPAFAMIPLLGPLLMTGALFFQTSQVDNVLAEPTRFNQNSMIGKGIPGNDQIEGSFFFPAVKATALKVGYVLGGSRQWLVIGPAGAATSAPEGEKTTVDRSAATAPPPVVPPLSVADAQRKLAALGYSPGTPDGQLGPRTMGALRRFQSDRGLPVTGKLDTATEAALRVK